MKCPLCSCRAVVRDERERRCLLCGYVVQDDVLATSTSERLPIVDVARQLHCGINNLRRWIDAGWVRADPSRGHGHARLVNVVEVAAYMAARYAVGVVRSRSAGARGATPVVQQALSAARLAPRPPRPMTALERCGGRRCRVDPPSRRI